MEISLRGYEDGSEGRGSVAVIVEQALVLTALLNVVS